MTKEELKAEFRAVIDEITSSTENISADLDRLAGTIQNGLSIEEGQTIAAELREKATRLREVADKNPETTPPGEEEQPQG